MPTELPPHVGPERQGFAQYTVDCAYTGLTPDGPLCGLPATVHMKFRNRDGYEFGSTACDEHAKAARHFGIVDEHPTAGSACCMPSSLWIEGPPSKCVLDDTGIEPVLTETRELAASSR